MTARTQENRLKSLYSAPEKYESRRINSDVYMRLKYENIRFELFLKSYLLMTNLTIATEPLGVIWGTTLKSWMIILIFYCRNGFYGQKYIIFVFNLCFRSSFIAVKSSIFDRYIFRFYKPHFYTSISDWPEFLAEKFVIFCRNSDSWKTTKADD